MSGFSSFPKQDLSHYKNSLTVTVSFTSATWNTVGTHEVLDITGAVFLQIFPVCQGDLTGAGSIQLGTDTSTNAMVASTVATNINNGEIWASATPSANLAKVSFIDQIVTGDVGFEITGSALTGGTLLFVVFWEPAASGSTVVAGAGGAL